MILNTGPKCPHMNGHQSDLLERFFRNYPVNPILFTGKETSSIFNLEYLLNLLVFAANLSLLRNKSLSYKKDNAGKG